MSIDFEYRHTFTDASHLLNAVVRDHYSLTYKQAKAIFEDILEQIQISEDREEGSLSFWDTLMCE